MALYMKSPLLMTWMKRKMQTERIFRMFIRVKGETEGYQITGEEEIIFLYINDSESKLHFVPESMTM